MTTYSNSLKLALIGDGEQTGVWGATTNTNLGTLLEQAICYQTSITMSAGSDYTLSNLNGAADESRSAVIIINGVQSGANSVICPAKQKLYIITNNLASSATAYFKPAGGTALAILTGTTVIAYCTGSEMVAVNYVNSSTYASVAVGAANLTGGSAAAIPYQSAVGVTTYLAPGTSGYVLTSGGSGAPPYWNPSGTATLASNLAGGGAGQIVYQSGANSTQFLSAGSTGQVLQSNGTAAPSWVTFTGATQSGTNTFSGVNSFTNATPVTFGVAPTVGGYNVLTTSTGAALNSAPTFTGGVTATGFLSNGGPYNFTGNTSLAYSSGLVQLAINGSASATFYTSGITTPAIHLGTGGTAAPATFNLYVKGQSGQSTVFVENGSGGQGSAFLGVGGGTINAHAFYYGSVASGVGTITVTSGGTGYNTGSDRRLKSNIAPLTNAGSIIDALQPKTFTWNANGEDAKGFIADELQQVIPSAVHGEPNAVDKDGNPKYQMVDASTPEMVALIICELQSLRKRVAQLEAK
jgi:hypothetical protein